MFVGLGFLLGALATTIYLIASFEASRGAAPEWAWQLLAQAGIVGGGVLVLGVLFSWPSIWDWWKERRRYRAWREASKR